jgi:hypothetical protein
LLSYRQVGFLSYSADTGRVKKQHLKERSIAVYCALVDHDIGLAGSLDLLTQIVNSVLQWLHHVEVGNVSDVSEIHVSSIFSVQVCRVGKSAHIQAV